MAVFCHKYLILYHNSLFVQNMKIVFIGAGNLATHLSLSLKTAGHNVEQVYSRTIESASQLAERLHCKATDSMAEVVADADIYIVSVKDDAVAELAPHLCKGRQQAVFVHTAGSVPMQVFSPYALRYGVVYPMQSFTKSRQLDLSHVPFYIEASDEATLNELRTLSDSVTDTVRELSSDDRRYLHLSAVFASNFVNYCYDMASKVVGQCGIPFSDLLPLIDETASKVHELSPFAAQTGPAVRYDRTVLSRQMQLLSGEEDLQSVYRIMSEGIHKAHEKKQ